MDVSHPLVYIYLQIHHQVSQCLLLAGDSNLVHGLSPKFVGSCWRCLQYAKFVSTSGQNYADDRMSYNFMTLNCLILPGVSLQASWPRICVHSWQHPWKEWLHNCQCCLVCSHIWEKVSKSDVLSKGLSHIQKVSLKSWFRNSVPNECSQPTSLAIS